jgi:hypothetical protein
VNKVFGAAISGFEDLAHDEAQMATFVASRGPLAIGVDATSFQTYRGGIVTNCISRHMNHGVLIVGFDETSTPPYWIIKNSWGTSWGEQGYIRVAKGSNQCMLTQYPTTANARGGPTPTSPVTTTAAPHGTFVEKTCKDAKCSLCTEEVLPQATCINGDDNDSFIGVCIVDGILMTTFTKRDCKGTSQTTVEKINVCDVIFENHTQVFFMRKCNSGPEPTTTPAPTQPQMITQKHCTDSACTEGCQSHSFPMHTCLRLSGGGSAIVSQCDENGVVMKVYSFSTSCTGTPTEQTMPVHKCLRSSGGGYFENICGSEGHAITLSGLCAL